MSRYSIWVLEYATSPRHPVSGVLYGAHNQGTMDLPFSYVLIKGENELAMIDLGYDQEDFGAQAIASAIGVTNWTHPAHVLAACGFTPDQVTHAVLTHAHFDHMGGTKFFANARFYIQERELATYIWTLSKGPRYRSLLAGINPDDILRLTEYARQGRLELVRGSKEDLLPGISLHPAFDTHSPGSQYVVVRNDEHSAEDLWVLAGDLVYTYANLHGDDIDQPMFVPPGLATGSQTALVQAADEMLATVGGEYRRVIPVHEARLREKFPTVITKRGLRLTEIALRDGEKSLVA